MAGFPESDLVRKTFTLRRMDFPPEISMTKRSLLRWFALSSGLISQRESRSTILDVLDAFFQFQVAKKYAPTTLELLAFLKDSDKKVDEKLLRYHVKRLTDLGLVERRKGRLSFVSSPVSEQGNLAEGYRHGIGKPVQESIDSVALALEKIQEKYRV